MKVAAAAAADEDEGGDDAALMDDSGDEMERKRSKQLAARWSQLEEDSVRGTAWWPGRSRPVRPSWGGRAE